MNSDRPASPLDGFASSQTDATDLYRLRDGLYAVDLLGAAIVELDFFTWLDRHPSGLTALCRALQIHERPADVMLTLFASMDLVRRDQGVFKVTLKAREFLVRGAPLYMGAYYAALKDRPVCRDFIHVLRHGKPANWGSFKEGKDWAKAMESEDFARSFTAAMDCRGRILGRALADQLDVGGCGRLLDVAGGSGIYACMIVAAHPEMRATVFEKPPVDRAAARGVADLGLGDRVAIVAGDMFRDGWPAGHDLHLLSNVLHDWDAAEVRGLLEKSYAALAAGGRLVIHDAWIDEDKAGPLPVAMYSCLLMHSSEGKCYSMAEIQSLADGTGFEGFQFTPTVLDRGFVTARKPA